MWRRAYDMRVVQSQDAPYRRRAYDMRVVQSQDAPYRLRAYDMRVVSSTRCGDAPITCLSRPLFRVT
jgi:hypothetical protein